MQDDDQSFSENEAPAPTKSSSRAAASVSSSSKPVVEGGPGQRRKRGTFPFKKQNWLPKKRPPRNLKAVLRQEHYDAYPPGYPTYESIAAPPSRLPARKYCDITLLPAPYTHPMTGLRFANAETYSVISTLTDEQVNRYLQARRGRKDESML